MTPKERHEQHSSAYAEIVEQWPAERIRGLVEHYTMSTRRLAAILGLSPHTIRELMAGRFTPSPTLCRRLEMVESQAKSNALYANVIPAKTEMRRRLLLFRAWWFSQEPRRDLPEITVRIRATWGKGKTNHVDLPVTLIPRLRMTDYRGLVDVFREVTKALKKLAGDKGREFSSATEEEFWTRYATDTLPKIVEERAKFPAMGPKARKWRPSKLS